VLPGDGIGPEVIAETIRVLVALGVNLKFKFADIGYGAYEKHGQPLPDETRELFENSDAALFGAVTSPPNIPDYRSPVLQLRQDFDLYVNLRPIINDKLNFYIIRENTEGLYSGVEHINESGDRAVSERIITRKASERIVRYAFELAKTKEMDLVTAVHKANVLRKSCGLFLNTAYEVAKEYPEITLEDMIVDRCAMELIRAPEHFQVLVTTNLFGDILSDEAAMLIGGLGMAYSGNIGKDYAMFEPVHGSAPEFTGTGKANPIACILSAGLMLEHLGLESESERLKGAVDQAIKNKMTTPDLGGKLRTVEVAKYIIENL
jgi:isopropylmalate/isohomocitrate dehydrogenase-like protein